MNSVQQRLRIFESKKIGKNLLIILRKKIEKQI